jgi:hypothetical protein
VVWGFEEEIKSALPFLMGCSLIEGRGSYKRAEVVIIGEIKSFDDLGISLYYLVSKDEKFLFEACFFKGKLII